jgi:hypothetical protein
MKKLMWCRIAEVKTTSNAVSITHEWSGADTGHRLRSALLRWERSSDGGSGRSSATIAGAAWERPGGGVLWGWPDDEGRVLLREGSDRELCSVLPPALSLALAIRRGGVEPGLRALVIGDGFAARYARAVTSALGLRVQSLAGPIGDALPEPSPEVLVETSGNANYLAWVLQVAPDRGTVYSAGGALTSAPLDYYTHVHRRALALTHVPERPVLRPEEEEIVERGAAVLETALRGITPVRDDEVEASVWPEAWSGPLVLERSGWGMILVDGSSEGGIP